MTQKFGVLISDPIRAFIYFVPSLETCDFWDCRLYPCGTSPSPRPSTKRAVSKPKCCRGCQQAYAEETRDKPLGINELKTFLQAAKAHKFRTAFILECYTGLRRGELLELRWTDINLENRTLTVKQAIVRTRQGLMVSEPKAIKSRRTIPISVELVAELKRHKAVQVSRYF